MDVDLVAVNKALLKAIRLVDAGRRMCKQVGLDEIGLSQMAIEFRDIAKEVQKKIEELKSNQMPLWV